MDRFHQVRDLVHWAARHHAHLANLYFARATERSSDSRMRMALGYVAEHEERMQKELEQYLDEDNNHQRLLETRFEDIVNVPSPPGEVEALDALGADTVQEALMATLDSHKTLHALYSSRARQAGSDGERELFESLLKQYEAESKRFSRNMQRLDDY